MARQPRFFLPGYPQHVIQRGNNRDVIFASGGDYRFYLEKLGSMGSDCEGPVLVNTSNWAIVPFPGVHKNRIGSDAFSSAPIGAVGWSLRYDIGWA
jgi:hypothetical protein